MDSINRTYRNADIQRWETLDFVVGYEIRMSNNPTVECDICKHLIGKYPKSFLWNGWHPQCMCYAVPILMDEETFDGNELGDLKAALRGTTYKAKEAKNTVKYVPKNFIDWFLANRKHFNETNMMPEFITNNIQLIVLSYEYYENQSE